MSRKLFMLVLLTTSASAASEWIGTPWQTLSVIPGYAAEAFVMNGRPVKWGPKDTIYPQPVFKTTTTTVSKDQMTKTTDSVEVDLLFSTIDCFSQKVSSDNLVFNKPRYEPGLTQFLLTTPPNVGNTCAGHQPILLTLPLAALTTQFNELNREEFTCAPETECLIRTIKTEQTGTLNLYPEQERGKPLAKPDQATLSYVTLFTLTQHADGTYTQVLKVVNTPTFK